MRIRDGNERRWLVSLNAMKAISARRARAAPLGHASAGAANFNSTGAIELLPTDSDQAAIFGEPNVGALITPGDLTFSAAQIYTATNSLFFLGAINAKAATNITFLNSGAAGLTSLSAGGAG